MEMTVQLTNDCSDPQKMVAFWAVALGYVPEPAPDGHATWRAYWAARGVPEEELPAGAGDIPESITDPEGRGPRVWFQEVPEPKAPKNRWHFDLKVGGGREVPLDVRIQRVKATVERLVKAGATVLRIKDDRDAGLYAAAKASTRLRSSRDRRRDIASISASRNSRACHGSPQQAHSLQPPLSYAHNRRFGWWTKLRRRTIAEPVEPGHRRFF